MDDGGGALVFLPVWLQEHVVARQHGHGDQHFGHAPEFLSAKKQVCILRLQRQLHDLLAMRGQRLLLITIINKINRNNNKYM